MQYKHVINLLLLFVVVGLILAQAGSFAQPATSDAAALQAPRRLYLPRLQLTDGTARDPYQQLHSRAAEACPQLGLNQLCYVGGPVNLVTQSGSQIPDTPGTVFDLATVQQLRLTAPVADSAGWGLVRMRLHANVDLEVLASGNAERGTPALGADTADLPRFALRSDPSPDSAGRRSSGLVVSSKDADLGMLEVNGVLIDMAGTIYLNAAPATAMPQGQEVTAASEPERPLDVTVTRGVAQAATDGGEQIAIQGQIIRIGKISESPNPAIQALLHDYLFDLLPPADPAEAVILADVLAGKLDTAIERCVSGRVRSIYNVLFWVWAIHGRPVIENRIDPVRLQALYNRVSHCLSFELEFESSATTQSGPISETSQVRAESIPISFNLNGTMRSTAEQPLAYMSHTYISPAPCTINWITLDGAVRPQHAKLRLSGNTLKIDLLLGMVRPPSSEVYLSCPSVPPLTVSESQWWTAFPQLHRDIWIKGEMHSFRFQSWRYTAGTAACDGTAAPTCPHVAEAIYQREETSGAISYNSDTHLILVDTPVR